MSLAGCFFIFMVTFLEVLPINIGDPYRLSKHTVYRFLRILNSQISNISSFRAIVATAGRLGDIKYLNVFRSTSINPPKQ